MKILAIESSCDETSASVVEKSTKGIVVHSNVTATSLALHAKTGGIIPENAARMQVTYIMPTVIQALISSKKLTKNNDWGDAKKILEQEIDAIAVTYGPGLIGSLLVGVETAKTLAFFFNKPLLPINHLLAHIYANFILDDKSSTTDHKSLIEFPFIGLIVSGAHTDLLFFENHTNYKWLGGTRDDAAGEAFDKIGRLLGLSYPAGAEIEKRAKLVSKPQIKFKSPIMHEDNFDFSFSGLKTEVLRYTLSHKLNESTINQVCFATQKAIIDVLVKKALKAVIEFKSPQIFVGGGVSASQTFKETLVSESDKQKIDVRISFPEKDYTTDNAAMIGAYALLNYREIDWRKISADPELYFS